MVASIADASVVNPNDIKTLSANGLSTFLIKDNPVFSMVLKVYLKVLLIAPYYSIEFLMILY